MSAHVARPPKHVRTIQIAAGAVEEGGRCKLPEPGLVALLVRESACKLNFGLHFVGLEIVDLFLGSGDLVVRLVGTARIDAKGSLVFGDLSHGVVVMLACAVHGTAVIDYLIVRADHILVLCVGDHGIVMSAKVKAYDRAR